MRLKSLFAATCMATLLAACGGGSGDGGAEAPPAATAPGGLYLGYYVEDPSTNPEDPTVGAFSLNLPAGNDRFSGAMFFTYEGCQTRNVGIVSGNKSGFEVSGRFAGTVDGTSQAGSYSGVYDEAQKRYAGFYTMDGGKQFIDRSPCVQYFIAPRGGFEMFPEQTSTPANFNASVNGNSITWTGLQGAVAYLIYIYNPAPGLNDPIVWQTIGIGTSLSYPVALSSGNRYLAAILAVNNQGQRLGFTSTSFTPK